MRPGEIDQAQMDRDFEELMDAPFGSPEFQLAQRCTRRAREIVWEHDAKFGPIRESVKLQDAIAEELSIIMLLARKPS